ncbi:MAG: cation diffusion facilitator family transporter [Clostridia bacterium]|nr:cation diffusion facilitator family transporter [Clostridia bacterium]
MKTERNILIAFILNLLFSIFEFIGGTLCGSVAIISDSIHDIGDAASIGFSYFLENKSKKQPDDVYTYGYARYSVIGSVITTVILLVGAVIVIFTAIGRIVNPVKINYNEMILFAVVGAVVNVFAAYFTKGGDSLNQKAVNLHMLEDVFGWITVLIGAVVMRFTDFSVIDPIMSVGVAIFILFNSVKNLKEVLDLFLEKTPHDISIEEIKKHILDISGVLDVHHVHVRSFDGYNNHATMHIVADGDGVIIKKRIKEELREHGIWHTTLELESADEECCEINCCPKAMGQSTHHHHHH